MLAFNFLDRFKGDKYTAVDFGHDGLKVVQFSVTEDRVALLKWGKAELPGEGIENGQVEDVDMVAGELEDLMEELSIGGSNLLFSPAVGQEFVRKHEMPMMSDDELKEALRWEVEEYMNLPPEKVASDFLILSEDKEKGCEVLLAVMPEKVLNTYRRVFEKLDYSARVANVQDLALISLLSFQGEMKRPGMIVNLGKEMARMIIASEDDFYLSRSVEIGGRHFTRVFKDPEMTWPEAESAKVRAEIILEEEGEEAAPKNDSSAGEEIMDVDMMVSNMDSRDEGYNVELKALADELVEEIKRSLDYYENRHTGDELSGIYITGGGFRLKGLKEYVEGEISANLEEIDPLQGIDNDLNSNDDEQGDLMVAAVGLVASEVLYNES